MRKSKCISCVILLILIALYSFFVYKVNQKYPKEVSVRVDFQEEESLQEGVALKLEKAKIYDNQEAMQKFGQSLEDEMADGIACRVVQLDVTLKNETKQEQWVDLYQLYLEDQSYANGIAADLQTKTDTPELEVTLNGEEEKEASLCYLLYENQFTKKKWKKMKTEDFWLARETYPEKYIWMLKEKRK